MGLHIVTGLFVGTHAEAVYFFFCEIAPVTTTEVLLGEAGKLYTVELNNFIAKRLEDATHDAVLARVNLYAHLLLVMLVGILDVVGTNLTIVEHNAFSDALHVMRGNIVVEVDMIDLLLEELRMRQLGSQVAIIGEQKHASSVTVETANGIDTLRAGTLDIIHDSLTLLGVITGGDTILGLVEEHVDFLLNGNGLVVEVHIVGTKHLGAQLSNYLAIDGDNTGLDELIGLATAANTGIGKELIKANGLVGIVVLLLVLDTLFHRVLGIRIIVGRTFAEPTLLLVAVRLARTGLIGVVSTTVRTGQTVRTVTTLLARLVTTLLRTGLITALHVAILLVTRTIALLRTRLIAAHLVVTILLIAGTIALLWTRLVATLLRTGLIAIINIIGTRAIRPLLWLALQTCCKALRTEASIIVIILSVVRRTFVGSLGARRADTRPR